MEDVGIYIEPALKVTNFSTYTICYIWSSEHRSASETGKSDAEKSGYILLCFTRRITYRIHRAL